MNRDEKETLQTLIVLGGLLCFAAGIAVGAITVERTKNKIDRMVVQDLTVDNLERAKIERDRAH